MDIINDILSYKDQMYRLALRITQNSQEAEDVVQDITVKAWRMREQLQEVDSLEAYLLRMTRNLSLDRQRLKGNHTESLEGVEADSVTAATGMAPPADEQMIKDERIASVRAVMAQMPEKLRVAMQLRDFEGYSYKEISDIMQISEDQVKVCIFRARQFVKAKFVI